MDHLREFVKAAPAGFRPASRCTLGHEYKYFVSGKGATLGILFEDSVFVYFEWLLQDGDLVPYGPEIRYKAWPKRELERLLHAGIWEPTCVF